MVLFGASSVCFAQILTESFDTTAFPPTGWGNVRISGAASPGTWARVTTGTNPSCTPHSGAAMAYYNAYSWSGGNAADLSSPALDFSSGSFAVSFWMYRDGGQPGNYDSVAVYVNTGTTSAGGTRIGLINRLRTVAPAETADGWYLYTFNIPPAYNTSTNHIIFKATSDFGNRIFMDDISVFALVPPADLTSVTTGQAAICNGSSTRLYANGIDGVVYWYTGSCGGTAIGTGDSITVSPTQATTYYARNYKNALYSLNCATQQITVNPTYSVTVFDTLCHGETYSLPGGGTADTTGTYIINLLSSAGCDSTVTLNLTVLPAITSNLQQTICNSDTFTYNGNQYTAAGQYTITLTASNGCDSIVTLNLTVLPAITSSLQQTICNGDTFTYNGNQYAIAGQYTNTLTASNGCDSTVTLNLTVLPAITSSLQQTICNGDTFTYNGNQYATAGQYTNTLTASNGCDSTVTLNLSVIAPVTGSIDLDICNGSSVIYNGTSYNTAGIYVDTLTAVSGCDSIVTITINSLQALSSAVSLQGCFGDTLSYNTYTFTSTGVYYDTLVSQTGCDSIITINVSILPALSNGVTFNLCAGQSADYNGQTYNTAGTYTDTLTASSGCDSVITILVNVLPALSSSLNISLCQGDSAEYNGRTYYIAGNYTDTLTATSGCDSIISITIGIRPLITSTVNLSTCPGDSVFYNGTYYKGAGSYADTLTSIYGCDSIVILNVQLYNVDTPTIVQNGFSLSTQAYSTYQWLLNNAPVSGATAQTYTAVADGDYSVLTTDANGCTAVSAAVNITGTGIEVNTAAQFALYPNPATYILNFKGLTQGGTYYAGVYNMLGAKVLGGFIKNNQLNIEALQSGVYTLSLESDKTLTRHTFVKQ